MKKYILQTQNVTKTFGRYTALNNVSISLEQGKVYGLIGQNGAGKTTLMRLIAGLSFSSEGTIELFGSKSEKETQEALKRIGCLIEYPSLNGNMTAKENLTLHRIIRGIPNKEIEDELLEIVGLNDTRKKKAKDFSLGMRQRLGIAIALLGSPELLILDEPINGLDPVGVVEIRNLLKKMCKERNMTILISSHNLAELYQTCTNYIIINKGEVKKVLTLSELEDCCKHHIKIDCSNPERLVEVLERKLEINNYKVMEDKSIKIYERLDEKERISKTIYENGVIPIHFAIEGDTLENYFLSVIGGGKDA
ncbi:ATP-binding cassette domain-containing protein [Clostridium bornimense]|uniref:ABC transporter ATP-binding protein n=1 Tax=Clostridium bornimense TaxID=1216932 RepID=UPI001C0F5A8D|nr:ATP-binding cassette domain-containing protein [Clostridium bornimense]MBU5316372.1 ATP-binding cassette domain-containing protein [Clostridium bornimense]